MASSAVPDARELSRLWAAVLGRLEIVVKEHQFRTWLRPTRPLRVENETLIVEAPTSFACDWLNQQVTALIVEALCEAKSAWAEVLFVPRIAVDCPAAVSATLRAAPEPRPIASLAGHVDRSFTFDRYIRGAGNEMAVRSCLDLLDEGDRQLSPLVVFGSPGMGKTHLLHALASKAHQQGWAVACFRAEEFTTGYMTAYREQKLPEFQAAVRGVRLFVLDDLQYLHGKVGIQEELVHIIDTVSLGSGYVAFGSERSPLDLGFTERLASRLVAGTSAHVQPFRYEERLAYAARVAAERHCDLPPWALERVAHIEAPSIRVVLGAVNAAISLARSGMLDLGRLDAELLMRSLESVAPKAISDRAIAEAIARHFQTTFEDLAGRSRKPAVTAARGATVAALKEHGRSNAEIAKLLGARDRTTISQLAGRGRELLDADPALRRLAAG